METIIISYSILQIEILTTNLAQDSDVWNPQQSLFYGV